MKQLQNVSMWAFHHISAYIYYWSGWSTLFTPPSSTDFKFHMVVVETQFYVVFFSPSFMIGMMLPIFWKLKIGFVRLTGTRIQITFFFEICIWNLLVATNMSGSQSTNFYHQATKKSHQYPSRLRFAPKQSQSTKSPHYIKNTLTLHSSLFDIFLNSLSRTLVYNLRVNSICWSLKKEHGTVIPPSEFRI